VTTWGFFSRYCDSIALVRGITVSEIIFEGGYKTRTRARVITRKESCSNISAPYNAGIKYFQRRDISSPTIFSLAGNLCGARLTRAIVSRLRRERSRSAAR